MPSESPNRFELRRQRNRAALMKAAFQLFQRHGVEDTNLEAICERADVSPRTFFNHFESRQHLYRAIAEERSRQLAARLDALGGGAADAESGQPAKVRPFPDQLRALFGGVGGHLSRRPRYRELVGEMLHLRRTWGSETVRGGRLGRAFHRVVASAAERGEITDRHAPEVLADILVGALVTSLSNWCADDDFDLETELARSAAALLDLFAPIGAGAR